MTAIRPRILHAAAALVAACVLCGSAALASPASDAPASLGPAPRIAPGAMQVAPYLAYWKSRQLAGARLRAIAPTANQGQYDVHYYDLDLAPDPATQVLTGSVRVLATVTSGPLATLDLDFASATAGGQPAATAHASDVLTITLDRTYDTGELVDVTVHYHGQPGSTGFGAFAFHTHNGQPLVWSLSEPFGAHQWWPCKDQPDDKADSVDVHVTTPSGMITASNGLRVEQSDDGIVAHTHWRERYPISSYLVSIACYAYATSTGSYVTSLGDTMPLMFFNFPDNVVNANEAQAKLPAMLAAFASRFGPYPFEREKYGHAEFDWGGGMEHQTCTSLGSYSEYVVAHELSHQWWGDNVTCQDFHHIWLNEGFATYCEALWAEAKGGYAAYKTDIIGNRFYGTGTVYVPELSDVNRIFSSSLTYNKGSWVLHMLRHVLGDATFFTAMRTYRETRPYGNATTEDFEQVCETVSGRDLHQYFQQWVYGELYPNYRFVWSSTPAGGGYDLRLQIQQTQSWQLFTMPVDVRIHTAAGDTTLVLPDSLALQVWNLHVPNNPQSVTLDPDEWILRKIVTPAAVEAAERAGTIGLAAPNPNPCRTATRFAFTLPRSGEARLSIVDAAGRRLATLANGTMAAGVHELEWTRHGAPLAPGVYWVRLEFGGGARSTKLVVLE